MAQLAKRWARFFFGLIVSLFMALVPAKAADLMKVAAIPNLPVFGEDVAPTVGAALLCDETPGDAFCTGVTHYAPLKMTPQTARLLADINLRVNLEVDPVDDIVLWNEPERWNRPIVGANGRLQDDCDGYVIEKWYRLVSELGLPSEAFYPLYADVPGYGGHLVLAVATDRGTFILDNLTDEIVPLEAFSFTFLKRPRPGHRLDGLWERFLAHG